MSIAIWWPLALLLVSNVMYNVCAKKLPGNIDAFAALTAIYLVAAVMTGIMFFVTNKDATLIGEFKKFNWVVPLIAFCIVGMEVGTLYLYKVGWPISVGMLINNALVSVCLVVIGVLFFKEAITLTNIIGIIAVMSGIVLINK